MKTAIESIISEFYEGTEFEDNTMISRTKIVQFLRSKFEVEKQQIKDAYDIGWERGHNKNWDGSEKYYQTTFKNNL